MPWSVRLAVALGKTAEAQDLRESARALARQKTAPKDEGRVTNEGANKVAGDAPDGSQRENVQHSTLNIQVRCTLSVERSALSVPQ